jgi:hypothetical protein
LSELSFRLCAVPASALHFGAAARAGPDSERQQAISPPAKITPNTLYAKFMREEVGRVMREAYEDSTETAALIHKAR